MAHVTIPHLSIPFRVFGVRGAAHAQQDSEEEILDCVELILRYTQGHRPEKPEFGIPDFVFGQHPIHNEQIHRELVEWEPRIEMDVGFPVIDRVDPLIQSIRIERSRPL